MVLVALVFRVGVCAAAGEHAYGIAEHAYGAAEHAHCIAEHARSIAEHALGVPSAGPSLPICRGLMRAHGVLASPDRAKRQVHPSCWARDQPGGRLMAKRLLHWLLARTGGQKY